MNADEALNIQINMGFVGQEQADAAKKTINEVTASTEQLTVGQQNLASSLPDLNAKTKEFVISSEAQYRAILAAHEAISAKIPVMAAAGKSTEEMVATQARLSAALSTSQALTIAEKIETKAAAEASLEKAAADEAAAIAARESAMAAAEAAVANEAQAVSAHVSAISMRETVVMGREIARGDYSRLAGSATILAQSFGMLDLLLNPVTIGLVGVGFVAYEVYEHFKKVNEELDKIGAQMAAPTFLDGIRARNDSLARAADEAQDYAAKLNDIVDGENGIITLMNRELELQGEINRARSEASSAGASEATAEVRADEARGKITPDMAIQEESDIKRKKIKDDAAAATSEDQATLAAKQAALTALQNQMPEVIDANTGIPLSNQAGAAALMKAYTGEAADRAQREKEGGNKTDTRYAQLSAAVQNNTKGQSIAQYIQFDQDALSKSDLPGFLRAGYQQDAAKLGENADYLKLRADKGDLDQLTGARSAFAADVNSDSSFNAMKEQAQTAQKNADAQDKLTAEIAALNAKIAATDPLKNAAVQAQLATVNANETAAAAKTDFGKDVTAENADAYKILTGQGGSVSPDSQKLIGTLGAMTAGHTVTLPQAAQIISKANANNDNYLAAFEAMNKTSDTMKNTSAASLAKLIEIETYLHTVAQQIAKIDIPHGQ